LATEARKKIIEIKKKRASARFFVQCCLRRGGAGLPRATGFAQPKRESSTMFSCMAPNALASLAMRFTSTWGDMSAVGWLWLWFMLQ